MNKEKIIGEKLVLKEIKRWEKRNKLVAKILKKKSKRVIKIPKLTK